MELKWMTWNERKWNCQDFITLFYYKWYDTLTTLSLTEEPTETLLMGTMESFDMIDDTTLPDPNPVNKKYSVSSNDFGAHCTATQGPIFFFDACL